MENDQAKKIDILFDGYNFSRDMNMFLRPNIEKLEAAVADHDIKIRFLFADRPDRGKITAPLLKKS